MSANSSATHVGRIDRFGSRKIKQPDAMKWTKVNSEIVEALISKLFRPIVLLSGTVPGTGVVWYCCIKNRIGSLLFDVG